jgi:hypothetical protein
MDTVASSRLSAAAATAVSIEYQGTWQSLWLHLLTRKLIIIAETTTVSAT